jgi:hypothetical protein
MKVYKAVTVQELNEHTRNGWTLEGEPLREQRVTEYRDTQGRDANATERQTGVYNRVYDAPKPFFGDVLIFVIWKEADEIEREKALESRANNAEYRMNQLNEEAKKAAEQIAKLTKERDEVQKRSEDRLQMMNERDNTKRKLEGDLAKIRGAIGDLKFKEILEGKAK